MGVGVRISFWCAKSRAFRHDRPRTGSGDCFGRPRRRAAGSLRVAQELNRVDGRDDPRIESGDGHEGLADLRPASLRAAQRKSRGGENFPLRKALKTHETGKSLGSDRQRGASPRETLRRRPEIRAALSVSSCTGLSRASRADVRRIIIDDAAWMPGSRPGMTGWRRDLVVLGRLLRWPQASANARPASRRAVRRKSRREGKFSSLQSIENSRNRKIYRG